MEIIKDFINTICQMGTVFYIPVIVIIVELVTYCILQKKKTEPLDIFKKKTEKIKLIPDDSLVEIIPKGVLVVTGLVILIVVQAVAFPDLMNKVGNAINGAKHDINQVILTMAGFIIPLYLTVISIDKTYYLVYSMKSILNMYHIYLMMMSTVLSFLAVYVFELILENLEEETTVFGVVLIFYMIGIFISIGLLGYICIILFRIVSSGVDLKALLKLHILMGKNNIAQIDIKNKKQWTIDAIEINLDYLIQNYKKRSQKVKIKEIESIEIITTIGIYEKNIGRVAKIKISLLWISAFICQIIFSAMLLQEDSLKIVICDIILIFCIIIIMVMAEKKLGKQEFNRIFIKMDYSSWGYRIQNKKKVYFVETWQYYQRKYEKFIFGMNSIIVFFDIMLHIGVKKKRVNRAFTYIVKELREENMANSVYYLPIFVIGYLIFERDRNEEILKIVKREYDSLNLNEQRKNEFFTMLSSYLFYLRIRTLDNKKDLLTKAAKEYLHWLAY